MEPISSGMGGRMTNALPVYETGRAVAEIQVDKIAAFVNESKAAVEE